MVADKSNPDSPASPPGGEGGQPAARADLAGFRLFRRAMRNRWSVPEATKVKAVERMTELLAEDEAGERTWTAATRTLISMTQADLAAVDTAMKARQQEELDKRLAEVERRLEASLDQGPAVNERGEPIEP